METKLMAKYKEERPFDTNISEKERFEFSRFKINYIEYRCTARLHIDNPELQCCRKTSRIVWMSAEDFKNDDINCLWSSTSPMNTMQIYQCIDQKKILHFCMNDDYMEWMLSYELEAQPQNQGQAILKSLEITEKHIEFFKNDFIEHCYPTAFMSFVSFKDYLRKYCEFPLEDKWLRRVFNGYADHTEEFGSHFFFDDLLLCLAFLDFDCPSHECRLDFVFGYYDFDRDGYLSEEEFREMVRDIDTNQSQDVIERVVSDNMLLNESDKGMTYEEFYIRVDENWLVGTDRLYRFDYQILRIILFHLENREKSGFKKRLNQYFRRLLND